MNSQNWARRHEIAKINTRKIVTIPKSQNFVLANNSNNKVSSAHDGNAKPPASGIPRDGLQCTEHLKYMGTICGGTVVLNDLEEFGRFEADEKSTSRQMPRSQMSWKTLESPDSNQRHLADRKIALYQLRQILNKVQNWWFIGEF